MLKQFIRDEEGVTAIEYGLIAALIAVMIIAGAKIIGVELDRVFKFVGTTLQGAPNP
ncbi:Flp/Fap pilin component family protein [Aromatoleum petrolei]|nr:Flp/Fap pilin component family protein [Aromatoleum petrolei]